jgi:hypothetical protein
MERPAPCSEKAKASTAAGGGGKLNLRQTIIGIDKRVK